MDKATEEILRLVADWKGSFEGAFNIRENGECAARHSSEHVSIEPKSDKSGIDIRISGDAKGESVYIPACISHGSVEDVVYNDFFVEEGADVTIVAGCGVHTDDGHESLHHGIHRFFLGKNSHVLYKEKHVGTGKGSGARRIDPVTEAELAEGSCLEMDTSQMGGVTTTDRLTKVKVGKDARLVIKERLLTDNDESAKSVFEVVLEGDGSSADLVSRSVARGHSVQSFTSVLEGKCSCHGHSECDAIISEEGVVNASPALNASSVDASLIHEAAIGKIAGEQLIKLQTLGLTEEEAEMRIIEGFLR